MTTKITYKELLNTPMWKKFRNEIIKRDEGKCKICGSSKMLHVHHKQYHVKVATGIQVKPWNYKLKYLVTLCAACHKLGHQIYKVKTFRV